MTNKTKKQMNKAQMKKAKGGIWVVDTSAGVADRPGRVSRTRVAWGEKPNGLLADHPNTLELYNIDGWHIENF